MAWSLPRRLASFPRPTHRAHTHVAPPFRLQQTQGRRSVTSVSGMAANSSHLPAMRWPLSLPSCTVIRYRLGRLMAPPFRASWRYLSLRLRGTETPLDALFWGFPLRNPIAKSIQKDREHASRSVRPRYSNLLVLK
jgi:hypothetical protein